MRRRPDWAARLRAFLEVNAERRFVYGEWDCCRFVCGAIAAMTDEDPGRLLQGRYRSREELIGVMAREFGTRSIATVAAVLARRAGMARIDVGVAQRGDVVVLRRTRGYSMGLIGFDGEVLAATAVGFARVPRTLAAGAWRV